MFILVASSFAEETKTQNQPNNPAIEKIDARLAELTKAWKDDTGTINRLTNFKRTPVQEGTQAYFQCLEASKRIQKAEAEAKVLKAQRSALTGISPNNAESEPTSVTKTGDGVGQVGGDFNTELDKAGQRMMSFWKESLQDSIAKKANAKNSEEEKSENSTQEQRAEMAKKLLLRLDTRNYVHPLEKYSPTLKFINANLTLQGKNLKEINALYENEKWLDLLSLINGSQLGEYPTIKTITSKKPSIEGLARQLGEMKFFLRLSPADSTKPILKVFDNQRYTIPAVMLPEAANVWDNQIVTASNSGEFSVHPDGESVGYLAEWSPEDGPVILKLPLRPNFFLPVAHILESTTERYTMKGNYFGEIEAFSENNRLMQILTTEAQGKFEKKVELGEISETEAQTSFLETKLGAYKQNLKFLTQW